MKQPAADSELRHDAGARVKPGDVVDAEGVRHRFAPFRHGSAPVSDQPAVRAAFADAARRGLLLPERSDPPVLWIELRKISLALARTDPVWRFGPIAAALAAGVVAGAVAFVAARFGTRRAFAIPLLEDTLLAVLVAMLAYLAMVLTLRARRRADAVVPSLLAIGRCAACGFPLRGEIDRRGEIDAAPDACCRCSECGAAWPVEAANRPRDRETGARADLPEVEGVGAWRTRLALGAALRATGHEFLPDGDGTLRYIARMAESPVSGARAFVGWLWSLATVDLLALAAAYGMSTLCFPGVAGCLFAVVRPAMAPLLWFLDSDSALAVAVFVGAHGAVFAWLAVMLLRRTRGFLVREQRTRQLRRHLRARVCPSCTMDLRSSREPLVACTCCGARWRCEPNGRLSGRSGSSD